MAQWIISAARGDPTVEQRKSMRREWQRGASVLLATLAALPREAAASLKGVGQGWARRGVWSKGMGFM